MNVVFFMSVVPKLPYIYILYFVFFNVFDFFCIPHLYIRIFLILSALLTILSTLSEGMSDSNLSRILGQSSMIICLLYLLFYYVYHF